MVQKIWTERVEKYKQVRSTVNKEIHNRLRYVIDPRTCKWLGAWDLPSFACLGFTAIATPIEVLRPCICAPRATPLRTHALLCIDWWKSAPPAPGEFPLRRGRRLVCGQLDGEHLLFLRPHHVIFPRLPVL